MSSHDARIDGLEHAVRAMGPTATQVARHDAQIDQLRDELAGVRTLIVERADRQDQVLVEIRAQVRQTNGRVTELERNDIAESAAKLARDELLTALRARRSWWPNTMTAVGCVLLAATVSTVLSLLT